MGTASKGKPRAISVEGFNMGSINVNFLAEGNTELSGTGVYYMMRPPGFHIKMMAVLIT